MTGKNIWRLCKVYGRLIGYPMLKPHDLRQLRFFGSSVKSLRKNGNCVRSTVSPPPGGGCWLSCT